MERNPLLYPLKSGLFRFRNRVVMAPLTRRRADNDHIPTDIMRIYYQQRASAGLIIAEATNISPQAVGYPNSPGIWNREQVDAWKSVVQAVHNRGGIIFLQLWHVGRVSHPELQPDGQLPVSASAIAASGTISTRSGQQPILTPRALEANEIAEIVNDYTRASLNAMDAGFDGVEIHAANGYLPDQFLHDGSNVRKDKYGGSVSNRCRFLLEITESCCHAAGAGRVGVRLSPSGITRDMFDSNPVKLFEYLSDKLNDYPLAYLHLMEPYTPLEPPEKYSHYLKRVTPHFRQLYKGLLITNVDYDFASANKALAEGIADMVAFGKLFISNPDLVERFRSGARLTPWDKNTFYHGAEKGYIDYPLMGEK